MLQLQRCAFLRNGQFMQPCKKDQSDRDVMIKPLPQLDEEPYLTLRDWAGGALLDPCTTLAHQSGHAPQQQPVVGTWCSASLTRNVPLAARCMEMNRGTGGGRRCRRLALVRREDAGARG